MQSVISALDESNPADYLRQLTDAYRLHLFNIVMQFRAIFSADAAGSDASNGATPAAEQAAPVLFSWAHHRVQFYVDQMQELLPRCASGPHLCVLLALLRLFGLPLLPCLTRPGAACMSRHYVHYVHQTFTKLKQALETVWTADAL